MKIPIFSIKKLYFSNKNSKILSINQFEFHRGAMYLFSGSMGSGKSTLMQILAKNKKIDKGLVFYEDNDICSVRKAAFNKDVVFIKQNHKRPWLGGSVKKYMIKALKPNFNSDYKKVLKKICNAMKIPNYLLDADISLISKGEFRWIVLSIGIALDSKVLIIDYLDKYLESNRRIILNRVLKRKTSHDGVTIIASSYNPDFFKMSTSVFIKIDKGRIAQVRSVTHKSK